MDINDFQVKTYLNFSSTEKTAYVLGTFKGKSDQAILIISAKVPKLQHCFSSIEKIFTNDIYGKFNAKMLSSFQIQTIFPVTEKHKLKYCRKVKHKHRQTALEYFVNRDTILKEELKHIDWVMNIVNGKAEVERVLRTNEDFVILPDFKFSHLNEVDNLHLLVIFKEPTLYSIRDLTGTHLVLLQKAESQIAKLLEEQFNLPATRVKSYFHYPPTFYRLHIHVMNLNLQAQSAGVERSHQLQNVMENISIKHDYYQSVSLNTFKESLA